MPKKSITEMTRKEFEDLPYLEDAESHEFVSMVILPGNAKDIHDSGYRCMAFVAVDGKNGALGKIGGGSDVLHLDGIGAAYDNIPNSGWTMDCLPKSGLMHVWPSSRKMRCSLPLSSFEVFGCQKEYQS